MRGQNLDGDAAIQAGIAGTVDLTHAAGAEGRNYLVRSEPQSWGQIHRREL